MPFLHRRGAATTEMVLLLTALPIAVLLMTMLFGRQVQSLYRNAASDLDAGRHSADPSDPRVDPDAGAPPSLERMDMFGGPPLIAHDPTGFDTDFELDEVERIRKVLDGLPAPLQALEIRAIMRSEEPNAGYDPSDKSLVIGTPLLVDDDGLNDLSAILLGANPRVSLERAVYHEMIHGYQHEHPQVAGAFLNLRYAAKYAALQADPRLAKARAVLLTAQYELVSLYGQLPRASHGRFDTAGMEQILQDRLDLRERIDLGSRAVSAIMLEHGLPSRNQGDAHAGGDPGQSLWAGGAEYFAIVWETARHDPEEYMRWRRLANDDDPGNDVLGPEEIQWMDDHADLQK